MPLACVCSAGGVQEHEQEDSAGEHPERDVWKPAAAPGGCR